MLLKNRISTLFTLLLTGIVPVTVSAQTSFSVSFPATVDTTTGNGQIITIMGTATNSSDSLPITIKMSVISQSLPYDWSLRLCNPSGCASSTTTTFTLAPSQTDSVGVEFNTGIHDMANGSATIRFANNNDTTDYIDRLFTLIYKPPTTTGIEETTTETGFLSQNYPNPFNNSTAINYKLDGSGATIAITDLSGKKIKEYSLSGKEGTITIKEDLKPGTYFYSLHQDEKLLEIKKMVVYAP